MSQPYPYLTFDDAAGICDELIQLSADASNGIFDPQRYHDLVCRLADTYGPLVYIQEFLRSVQRAIEAEKSKT